MDAVQERKGTREERLSAMIDTYQGLIFSVCYKVVGDYFAAEDLTQETFLSAYKNKGIDYLRGAGRRAVPTEDVFFEQQTEMRGSPEEICLEEEVKEQLLDYCSRLRPPYNEIAKAVYYEEKKADEIARERGENIKTVQTQIYRARDMLRKLYGKERSA